MLQQELKRLRKAQGITQSRLAKKLSLTQQAVARWEAGASAPDAETLLRLAALLGVTVDELLGGAVRAASPYAPPAQCMVPVIGTVRAGYGALAFEEDYGCEPAPVRSPENYFYLVVKGDSMEPRISDGDLALVRKQPALDDGDVGVLVYGEGEGTLKRFRRRGSTVLLQPFNPNYETLVLAGEELEHLYIAGKVIETRAKW